MVRPNRVAITGFGCISALGSNVPQMRDAILKGTCAIGKVDFDLAPSAKVGIAAQVKNFDLAERFSKRATLTLDRFSGLALHAAEEAVEDSGVSPAALESARAATVIGTGIGGQNTIEAAMLAPPEGKTHPPDPLVIPKLMPNAAASQISMKYGCRGTTMAISTACSSATQSIGVALGMLRSGEADLVIAGGSEAILTPGSMKTWEALKVLSPDVCRPFSRRRNGLVLGEGAAIFVLEREADVKARGGRVHAWLAGYGTSSDAGDLLRPDADGAARAMSLALENSGCAPEEVDYVNAHGTGTLANDANETLALKQAFGEHAYRLAISSTKSMHGHAMGAAGALELAAALIALQEQVAPPTVNWIEADENCDLDYVPNTPRPMKIEIAMSNSFAFGGINASLVIAHPERSEG